MYTVIYTYNDLMDLVHCQTFHETMSFILTLAKKYKDYSILVKDNKGQTIFRWVEIERQEEEEI